MRNPKSEIPFRGLLRGASLLYGAAVRTRRAAYRYGLLRSLRLPVPVISVGNLVAGGTGKTPLIVYLTRMLRARGKRAIILSRGYGRRSRGIRVASDGRRTERDWRRIGDEPALLADLLPETPIVVGRDRHAAGRLALTRFPADVVLLDDGFQHLRLARDVDIVVVDATDPLGGGYLLPRGLLREPTDALRRAHLFCLTRTDQSEGIEELKDRLRTLNARAPIVETIHRPTAFKAVPDGQVKPLSLLQDRKVVALSGIGRPASFERTLCALGVRLVDAFRYPDHHPYTLQDLNAVLERARHVHADFVVTTEKDAVRFPSELSSEPPTLALMVEIEVRRGGEGFEAVFSGSQRSTINPLKVEEG